MIKLFCGILVSFLVFGKSWGQGTANSQYPYQLLPGNNKYAAVVVGESTWHRAKSACETDLAGATLFNVDSDADSAWLGERINIEKDRFSGSSKFWVGLVSQNGPSSRRWLSGSPYVHHKEVVVADGDEDAEKIYAWAVPDSFTRLKYEFLTQTDLGESFICEYKA
ncbi:UNVERIFIED_CONTAM: hypothetical protein RMT77_007960 [Armadillidium vulgare]